MKKLTALLLVLVLCLSLAACDKTGTEGDNGNGTENNNGNNAVEQTQQYLKDGKNIITGYKTGDVTLGQYAGLTYNPLDVNVSDEEIEENFAKYLDSYKTKVEVTDRDTAQDGDIVDINFKGLKDGVAFEGGTGSKSDLRLGSNTFISDLEQGIIGHKKGEEFEVNCTFPENYKTAELAGADVVFEVKINNIFTYDIPEGTDEFVSEKTSGKYATVDAYKEYIRTTLRADKESNAEIEKQYELVQKLIANTTYNIDMEPEIERGVASLKAYNDAALAVYGMDSVGYYQTYLGMTEEQYIAMLRAQAELSVRYEFARSAIAEAERFQVTEEEIEELATAQMKQYAYASLDDYYAKLKELYGVEGKVYMEEQVKLNKASNLLFETAVPEKAE